MIRLENFSCGYPGQTVLANISLTIPSGEIIAVVGKNGSGKSTLAQVLSGLKLDFRGRVWLDDLELKRHTKIRSIREKVGLVLQNPDNQILFSTVYDDLAFVLDNLRVPTEAQPSLIAESLAQVGMSEFAQANPRTLSGGQRQRIVIASALLTAPEYLVLDEATSTLDVAGKRTIYHILQDLRERQVTSLMMTNWLDEIMIADRVLILDRHQIFAYTKDELLADLGIFAQHGLETPLTLRLAASERGKEFLC